MRTCKISILIFSREIFNGSKPWLIRFEESLSGNSCASQDQLGIGQAMLRELFRSELDPYSDQ